MARPSRRNISIPARYQRTPSPPPRALSVRRRDFEENLGIQEGYAHCCVYRCDKLCSEQVSNVSNVPGACSPLSAKVHRFLHLWQHFIKRGMSLKKGKIFVDFVLPIEQEVVEYIHANSPPSRGSLPDRTVFRWNMRQLSQLFPDPLFWRRTYAATGPLGQDTFTHCYLIDEIDGPRGKHSTFFTGVIWCDLIKEEEEDGSCTTSTEMLFRFRGRYYRDFLATALRNLQSLPFRRI